MREQYVQSTFRIGTLYADAANDSVTPTKPKVEILPFTQAGLVAVRDFDHFRDIAGRYWGGEFHPTHVLPALAPHCPLFHVGTNGRIQLHDPTDYMLALTRRDGFTPSEDVLRAAPMPHALFERVRAALKGSQVLPLTPGQGRGQALRQCRMQHQALAPGTLEASGGRPGSDGAEHQTGTRHARLPSNRTRQGTT